MKRIIPLYKKVFFRGIYRQKEIKAQSFLEYAIVIMCLVLALLTMQVYIKRGMQGRLRTIADELGQQYSPRNTIGTSTLTSNSTSHTQIKTLSEQELNMDIDGDGIIEGSVFGTESLSVLDGSTTTQTSDETVGPLESSLF